MQTIYFAGMASVGVYVAVAAGLRASGYEPAFAATSGTMWALRGAFGFIALAGQLVADQLPVRSAGTLRGSMWQDPGVATAAVRTILRMAFSESIAIFGLLLFLLGGSLIDLGAFALVSLSALGLRFPTKDRWAQAMASTTG